MPEILNAEEKEINLVLDTGEGQNSFSTGKIIGKLDAIITNCEDKISIIIESEFGYLIMKRNELQGVNYFSIRNRTNGPTESPYDIPGFEKFNLNESLLITVMGQANSEVYIILRFS